MTANLINWSHGNDYYEILVHRYGSSLFIASVGNASITRLFKD